MANISQITLPSGSTYDIKDATARADILTLQNSITGGIHYIGVTTSNISDGDSTNPISIGGKNVTAVAGDLVIKGDLEFIWGGTTPAWHEFGSTGSLKALAFKDSASGSYTPAGTVSKPTFSGTKASGLKVSGADATGTNITYTPKGSVSQPIFEGTAGTASATYTPAGSVTVKAGGNTSYTPAGTVSQPTFKGTAATIAVSGGTGTATYTPTGSVSKPDITVTPSTTTVNSITGVGTLPSLTTSVSDENLTISFSQGTLPTKGGDTSVMTSATAALASAPSFTGNGTRLTASYTPAGSVTQPTFSGTAAVLTGSFSGTEATISSSYTPAGTVSQPSFTGNGAKLTLEDYTPAGTVSQPTFSGTTATVTVS